MIQENTDPLKKHAKDMLYKHTYRCHGSFRIVVAVTHDSVKAGQYGERSTPADEHY